MVDCIDCNPNVFDVVADDSIVTSSGYSLKTELDGIKTELATLSNVEEQDTEGGIGELTLSDSPLTMVASNPFQLKVIPGRNSTSIEFDLRNSLPNGSRDIVNVEMYGMSNGVAGRLFRGTSSVGSYVASPENFPVSFKVDVTSLSSEGQQILNFQKSILNSASTTEEYPTITDLTKKSLSSQKDVNEMFDTRIGAVQNQITQLNNVSSNGKVGLPAIFADIQTQLKEGGAVGAAGSAELQSEIDNLNNTVEAQAKTINEQTDALIQLQSQIDTLRKLVI